MWELGNLWGEGKSSTPTPANSYLSVMREIHVLLADHDSDALMNTANLLEICQYRVTFVELASAAMQMLSSGKAKFDIIMANINSPDLHGFKLLQQAANMDIPIILMSVDDNTFMATRAIENGALLYIKKPVTIEMLKCVWQHVMRNKVQIIRERDRFMAANYSERGIEFRHVIGNAEENPNPKIAGGSNMLLAKDKGKSKKKGRNGANGDDDDDYGSLNNHMVINGSKIKRKVCTEWTQELHEKFMEAVQELGEGRCFPKEILELMNLPGLTRMQVASHLQKCRNDNWRSPEERKSSSNLSSQPASSDSNGSQHKPRRFGSMPRLLKLVQDSESSGVRQGSKSTDFEPEMPNAGNESVTTNPHPPPPPPPHYGSLVPHPNMINATGAGTIPNPRHQSDDFFSFPDMECLIQNFPPASHVRVMNSNPDSSSEGYCFGPVYNDQNSTVPSMDSRSSQTSNYGSDESDSRGH